MGRAFFGLLIPRGDAALQAHAEMAQGPEHLADLRGFLARLNFGDPLLAGTNGLAESGLGEPMVLTRGGYDLPDFSSRLCPHEKIPVIAAHCITDQT